MQRAAVCQIHFNILKLRLLIVVMHHHHKDHKLENRFGVIFLFGLFHGLGFAGAIAEVGFPKEGFIAALLGFNVGIELGQLSVVAVVFPLLMFLDKKYPLWGGRIRTGMGYIILAGGCYWFITRLFF